jgi:hypothetical protein
MELFAAPRPDHSPPESLDDAELARAIDSLGRKLRSVRASLRTARLAGLAVLAVVLATGFTLLWIGPDPFLPRIFGDGTGAAVSQLLFWWVDGAVATVPELLFWWVAVITVALFVGIVSYRLFAHRMHIVSGWRHKRHKAHELERRLEHAEAEARRRGTG